MSICRDAVGAYLAGKRRFHFDSVESLPDVLKMPAEEFAPLNTRCASVTLEACSGIRMSSVAFLWIDILVHIVD